MPARYIPSDGRRFLRPRHFNLLTLRHQADRHDPLDDDDDDNGEETGLDPETPAPSGGE